MTRRNATIGPLAIAIPLVALLVICGSAHAQVQTVGLFTYDSAASPGYTLFTQLRSTSTYLIDMWGRSVHTWPSTYTPGMSVYLLEDGSVLRTGKREGDAGSGGQVQKIAWDGTLVWDFEYFTDDYLPHHDIEPMPNGNVLILAWEHKTAEEAFAAGRDPGRLIGSILSPEKIVEVMPTGPTTGEIVWEWHLWDHLIQDFHPDTANYGVVADHPELADINYMSNESSDWIHGNAIAYNSELDQIMICCHNFHEFWVIDHSTTTAEAAGHTGGNNGMGGDILYRWGNPQSYRAGTPNDQQLFGQHDSHWIPSGYPGAGNVLLFNNGRNRPGGDYSSVDEIVPTVGSGGHYPLPAPGTPFAPAAPTWTYTADPPTNWYASSISGAQRLINGNTLICSGPEGRFFEVTPDHEIVWEYVNPISALGPIVQGVPPTRTPVFRCYRYAADYPGLVGRDLTPGAALEVYPITISGTAHSPPEPFNIDSVVVTTTLTSESVITVAELNIDTGDGFFAVILHDDGDHHDGLPGDGLYGTVIPPYPAETAVSYYVRAEDGSGSSVPDPPNPPHTTYGYFVQRVCTCPCYADPHCDGVATVLDVVLAVSVAFQGAPPVLDDDCLYERTDANCSAATDVLDVVAFVNVAFRGGDPAVVFCDPCAP